MQNGMGTLLNSPAASSGRIFAYLWPVEFGRGQIGRNGLAGTWCGRLIITCNDGGSENCIQGIPPQVWGNIFSGLVRDSMHPQRLVWIGLAGT